MDVVECIVKSPLTGNTTKRIECLSVTEILDAYKNIGLDVAQYYLGIDTVSIFECCDTGYRFYYPFTIMGDPIFYESLQKVRPEYYPLRWEHQQAAGFIKDNDKILDIGCGSGNFLLFAKSKKKNLDIAGLEFNDMALQKAREQGLKVNAISIEEFSSNNKQQYDVVSAFQVLEHITDVSSFLKGAVECLKPGGRLIIGVPNNYPYVYGTDKYHALNLPPHHAGLWNKSSLASLCGLFGLKQIDTKYDPFNNFVYHGNYFINSSPSLIRPLLNILSPLVYKYYQYTRWFRVGQGITVVYEKL